MFHSKSCIFAYPRQHDDDKSFCCPKADGDNSDIITCGSKRITNIIRSSQQRGEYLHIHLDLQSRLQLDPELKIHCHKSCVSTYTSAWHMEQMGQKRSFGGRSLSEPPVRRSKSTHFYFQKHCLFCGEVCLSRDQKNPQRWRKVIKCQTADRPGLQSFKHTLLHTCDERGDAFANEVRLRLSGAPADLHAADAQYHKDCYDKFIAGKDIDASSQSPASLVDETLLSVANAMKNEQSRVWTSVELHEMYVDLNSVVDRPALSRRQFIRNLISHLGSDVVEMKMNGCASLVAFKQYIPYKLCKVGNEEDGSIDNVVEQIRKEVKEIVPPKGYDMGQFDKSTSIKATSPTLLTLISRLISNDDITRRSHSIAQTIQTQISNLPTPTTLGLALKLHHKYGSKELITMLHDYGYIVSYDEVLRFRTSAAKYVGEQDLTVRGMKRDSSFISSWCDNYDLHVNTPTGNRETHAMVIEFTQPQSEKHESDPGENLIIPRLPKADMASANLKELSSVTFEHYHGPKKPLPPTILSSTCQPVNFSRLQNGLTSALTADIDWLCEVVNGSNDLDGEVCEWAGYMSRKARQRGVSSGPTDYIFGPMVDATPSHPDTVLTTLTFIEKFIHNHGQKHMMVVADMQLFQVIQRIKWSDPDRWNDLIPRPGGMHTLMSFIGCIGTLMKASGFEEILGGVFGGVGSMLNGKAWPRAVRAFRMVASGLLKDVIISDGITTLSQLETFLDDTCKHPTGKLWVQCFILPVAIMLLFIRAEHGPSMSMVWK